MRTLVVTNAYPTSADASSGVFVEQQVGALRELGVHVDVFHVDRHGGRRTYATLSRRVARTVAESRPDVVHVAYGGIMAEIVTRAVREAPVVVSFCGSDLLGSPAEPFPRRLECRLGVVASHIAARRAAAIVVKSRNLRDALPRDAARGNVWILPSGIDMRLFAPLDRAACRARLGWAANRRHVLFPAAANRPEKRYGLAEETVAALRARGHDVDLHELRGVAHADVPAWMNAADVVLITSTHEGSPNAVKEALACEVPIVSVDVGDVADRLASIDGAYVAAANADALASAVERVLSGPGRVDARATLEDISLERIAAKQREIYEIAVAGETRAKAA